MTIRLQFIRETALARLYTFKSGEEIWIPKSVTRSCVKFPPKNPDPLAMEVESHELTIEDWWWEKWEKDQDDPSDDDNQTDMKEGFYDDDN